MQAESDGRFSGFGGSSAPPYTSYRTFRTFLGDLREQGVPSRIDRSVLTRFSGVVGTQLLHALRFLGLIDEQGRPTRRLGPLVEAQAGPDWAPTLADVIRSAYAPMFRIDLETATPSHFNETFRKAFPAAEAVAQKCVTFFLYATTDAGLKMSPRVLKGRKPRPLNPRKRAAPPATRLKPAETEFARAEPLGSGGEGSRKPSELLLSHLNPKEMSEDEQAAVWTLMKYFKAKGL